MKQRKKNKAGSAGKKHPKAMNAGSDAIRKRRKKSVAAVGNPASGMAFMHIPKTGGTSMATMFKSIRQDGHVAPRRLGHAYTLRRIVREFPDMKVSFVLRDPIERACSGFLSGMRMGRPTNTTGMWRPPQAVAFAFFHDAKELLRSLASDDERMKSAAYYAFANLRHLKSNYVRYFESVDYLEENLHRFAVVGEMGRFSDFASALVQRANPAITDVSPYYAVKHVSQQKSSGIMDNFTDAEKERIRAFFAEDYKIYDRLRQLINC